MVEEIKKKMLEGLVLTNPLALLLITDLDEIQFVNKLLPYSTGFEIECYTAIDYKKEYFTEIPSIMAVEGSTGEQRYRIPNGINGILCLYFISIQAKLHLTLNPDSGIHYHCDCTGISSIKLIEILHQKEQYILSELDSWGALYSRHLGSWYRYNSLGTIEYRVGEMTFDYTTWIKRIIHANQLTKEIKIELGYHKDEYQTFKKYEFIEYLKQQYKNKGYTKEEKELLDKARGANPNQIVKSRTIKL